MRIQRGDTVVVVSGDDAGPARRKVTQIHDGGRKLTVEGVNRVHKHVRRGHPKSPSGGRLHLEMPIDSSNVMLYCDACSRGVRIGFRYTSEGRKERYCKSCGHGLGAIGKAKKQHASQ